MTPDEYQLKVINSLSKDIVVLAGAGSGKTFTLLSRIHKLVTYRNVDPSCILVLTFTRVAAENMRRKYLQLQDSNKDDVPDFHTFHAFCYSVLSEYQDVVKELGYTDVPAVADDKLMDELESQARRVTSCTLSKTKLLNPGSLTGKEKRQAERFASTLQKMMKSKNLIDYDSLCERVCYLFTHRVDCVLPLISRYKYIFVDEFQDTDLTQYEFVKSMSHCERVLCGDALQNIYQFRGCSNEPLKELINDRSWTKYVLPHNYRSSVNICSYVNKYSRNFRSSEYAIELESNTPGPCVRVYTVQDELDKYNDLVKYVNRVKNLCDTQAVLCRTNAEVDNVAYELSKRGISYTNSSIQEYKQDVLEACLDTGVMDSFVERYASKNDLDLYTKRKLSCIDYLHAYELSFSDFCNKTSELVDLYTVVQTVNKVACDEVDIDEVVHVLCHMFNVPNPDTSLKHVNELLDYMINRVLSSSSNSLYVGTVHSVKGLEFDSVVVMNVGSRCFKVDKEETENLWYTACTRAKRYLMLFEYRGK